MAVSVLTNAFTKRQRDMIENLITDMGYIKHENAYPPREIVTNVVCPVCGENLILWLAGNSYQVDCKNDGKVYGIRGI
jgi:predicted RNA-binding Zn-ribbon protein involved in translation (DUF1610 family)